MDFALYNCRNKVYRMGVAKRCNRSSDKIFCESCAKALEERRQRLLGISEAKKEPSNKPDDLEVEDSFEVHDDYDGNKKKPDNKQKRKSSLQDGPEGEKGSKKKPYLEQKMSSLRENAEMGMDLQSVRDMVVRELDQAIRSVQESGDPRMGSEAVWRALSHLEQWIEWVGRQ